MSIKLSKQTKVPVIIFAITVMVIMAWRPVLKSKDMKRRNVERIIQSESFYMGKINIKQPLPTKGIDKVGPFLLLHHGGPKEIKAGSKKFRIDPHPHRGFEPVTFIFDGLMEHHDSKGNHGLLDSGDVQWMTAVSGIVHSEGPPETFFKEGGRIEIIQLWVNLPKINKMTDPNYQDIKKEFIPVLEEAEGTIKISVVTGDYKGKKGPAISFTPMTILTVIAEEHTETSFSLPSSWGTLLYLLDGSLIVNDKQTIEKEQMIIFDQTGETFDLKITKKSKLLILSGEPINEPMVSHGPFVMNSVEEINQAIEDYHAGKMGVLTK
jgi:redox-sensitive bicupin YhaK (pirin superfamily)